MSSSSPTPTSPSPPTDLPKFKNLFQDGSQLGLHFSYAEQPRPEGLAQAFVIGKDFIGRDPVCLILGDNLFYGYNISKILKQAAQLKTGGLIFGYRVWRVRVSRASGCTITYGTGRMLRSGCSSSLPMRMWC